MKKLEELKTHHGYPTQRVWSDTIHALEEVHGERAFGQDDLELILDAITKLEWIYRTHGNLKPRDELIAGKDMTSIEQGD